MAVKPKFKVTVDEPKWLSMIRAKQQPVAVAAEAALRDVAAQSVQDGRKDIAAASPGFSKAQWVSGLQYRTFGDTVNGQATLSGTAVVFHKYGIAGVFESGANIKGSPLLWLPTTPGAPRIGKSRKKLAFATVRGTPMAFDTADKSRTRKPLYIGVPQVNIPKKFHIHEIVKDNVAHIGAAFLNHFKDT